ncbi:MAG: hemolysin activation/secretion protein [Phycisphaerales bacterium]
MRAFSVVVASVLLAASGVCLAQPEAPLGDQAPLVNPELERDGLAYPVSDLVLEYPIPHPMLPDLSVLEDLTVTLTSTSEGYIAPIGTAYDETVRLGDLGDPATTIYGSALAAINARVRDFLSEEYGLIGHLVTPSSEQVDYEGSRADLRAAGDTTLKIQIWRASIGEIRTLGLGQKWESFAPDAESGGALDQPEHARIRESSPLQQGDLLVRPPLDREIQQLNRHPGRRADLALSPTGSPGQVNLDYLITEARDWFVYGQLSNTGSESTDEWVYRMGVQNHQLTGNDDILRLDYITAGFDATHAVLGSYEVPLSDSGRLRGKVFGRYSEYTANDVGFGFDDFEGQGYELGAEAALNLMQRGPLFIDAVGGARYESISVDNNITAISGEDDFFIPYVGARAQRITPAGSFVAEALLDFGFGSDQAEAERLGRFGVDEEWTALRGSATLSFYLEPFLDPEGFDGERGPEAMTLAHEVYFSVRGQWSMGNRLIPNYQQVGGGFFTVRGYDESVAVGDNVVIATAEYRFHLGKSLPMATEPVSVFGRPFRASRTEPFGSADWDVILRAFADVADVGVQDADPASETEDTLSSVGLGIEARLKQNLTVRVDYGYTLSGVGEGVLRRADSGDSRVHFMATFLF